MPSAHRQPMEPPCAVPADTMTLLGAVGRDLNTIRDRNTLLEFILTQCRLIFRCRAASVFLFDEAAGDLALEASHGDPPRAARGLRLPLGQGVAGQVAQRREAMRVDDVRTDPRLAGQPARDSGYYSFLCAPLLHFGELTGVVCLTMRDGGGPFAEADLPLLEALAAHFASAIRGVALFDETRRFAERLQREVDDKTAELARLQAFTERVVQSIPSGVMVIDAEGLVRFASHAAAHLLGRAPTDGAPAPLEGFGERAADIDDAIAATLSGGAGRQVRETPYKAGGESRLLDVGAHPFADPDTHTRGALVVLTDVTEAATVRQHLDESQKLAAVGRLAAKVAHEMNNPLDAILRYIGMAQKRFEPGDDGAAYLDKARKGLLRVGRTVKDLLQFSRTAAVVPNETDLNHLIVEALDYFAPRIAEQGIEVEKAFDASVPHFAVGGVFEVFTNLIKNALDAMPGGGRLTLRTEWQGGAVRADVADTGEGMTADTARRIFEPFFSTKAPGQGTGLGMAICKDVVERRGGRIVIRSKPGQGTTVTVTLPVRAREAA